MTVLFMDRGDDGRRALDLRSCPRPNPLDRFSCPFCFDLIRLDYCALLDVSPRDRRLCVLPGWQMNGT